MPYPRFQSVLTACVFALACVVAQALEVIVDPPAVKAKPGGSTTLTATAPGAVKPSFAWRRNGVAIQGGTLSKLVVYHQYQNIADYDVVVEAENGVGLSKPVRVEVESAWDDQVALRYRLDQPATPGKVPDATGHSAGVLKKEGRVPRPLAAGIGQPFGAGWDFEGATVHPVISPCPALASLGDAQQGSGLTVAFWVKMPDSRPKGGKMGQQLQSDTAIAGMNQFLYLVQTSTGGIYGQFGIDYYTPYCGFNIKPLTDGAWHHIILSCDFRSGLYWSFVDGVRQKTGVSGQDDYARVSTNRFAYPRPAPDEPLHLGADGVGKRPWKGGLADFIFFTKPLKDEEAKALATMKTDSDKQPPIADPVPTIRIVTPRVVLLPDGAEEVKVKVRAVGAALQGPVTFRWANGYHVTKEMMQIEAANEQEATVTLHRLGDFGITCTASNGARTDTDYVTIRVAPNLAPTLGAIETETTALTQGAPHTVTLKAMVNDDLMPNPPAQTVVGWSQVSGPAAVKFLKPWSAKTSVQVPGKAGAYRLRLTAHDGAKLSSSEITLTVGQAGALSLSAMAVPSTIDLNTVQTASLSVSVKTGTAVKACHWRQTGGPAGAVIAKPDAYETPVSVNAIGCYTFEATVTTPDGTATATAWFNCWQPGALMVHAGSSRLAWLPDAALCLSGATNAGTGASVHWSKLGGPGDVTFSAPERLATKAVFSTAGTYELQLDVVDGRRHGQGRMVVEVYNPEDTFGGFTKQELEGYTTDLNLNFDTTYLAWERILPAPAPGVHPRILFNPEELPGLRRRLKDSTVIGPLIMAKIREEAAKLSKDGEVGKIYAALVAGDIKPFTAPRAPTQAVAGALQAEAFRTLIEEDAPAAAKAAAAVANLAEYLGQVVAPNAREHLKTFDTHDWRVLYGLHAEPIAWSYDFLYNAMTPAQRMAVRRLLVRTTDHLPVMGLHVLPGPDANNSNWLPLTSQGFLFSVLAIEGEEGADPEAIRAYTAALNRQTRSLGWPDGTLSEGGGKGWLGCEQYFALAKRGSLLVASDTFRNYLRQFFLHCLVPEGYGFTMDEMNGGTAIKGQFTDDIVVTKYLYPKDPLIDFVYRNAFSSKGEDPTAFRVPFKGGLLLAAICAENFQSNISWEEALAKQIHPAMPKTCWFPYRGLLVTRSDWTPDATRLYFQPRTIRGGHTNPDRNCFVLHALGRAWVPMWIYQSGSGHVQGDISMPTSIVRVDDQGSGDAPSGEVDFFDSPRLTCATGDASDAYRTAGNGKGAPSEIIPYTFNQKHLRKLNAGWADLPAGILPSWYTSEKQARVWSVIHPDARAFRTVGLMRPATNGGKKPQPYVLIADDIQIDNAAHNYKWRMMLPDDLRNRATVNGSDVVYTAPDGKTGLLVRLLNCAAPVKFLTDNHSQYFDKPWLDLSVDTIAPNFRVMLLPFTTGSAFPTTTWEGTTLVVDHGNGCADRIVFNKEPSGWTKIRMEELHKVQKP